MVIGSHGHAKETIYKGLSSTLQSKSRMHKNGGHVPKIVHTLYHVTHVSGEQ